MKTNSFDLLSEPAPHSICRAWQSLCNIQQSKNRKSKGLTFIFKLYPWSQTTKYSHKQNPEEIKAGLYSSDKSQDYWQLFPEAESCRGANFLLHWWREKKQTSRYLIMYNLLTFYIAQQCLMLFLLFKKTWFGQQWSFTDRPPIKESSFVHKAFDFMKRGIQRSWNVFVCFC